MCIDCPVFVDIKAFSLIGIIPNPCSNTQKRLTPQGNNFTIAPYCLSKSL
nr:MAG TPA: hypothetical protein [Caudoviricetes sp.]